MRNFVLVAFVVLLTSAPTIVSAQTYPPPSRAASPSTPEQDAALRAGAELHDQGKYDEAIAKYEEVLKANPGNMTALYEIAFTYSAKNDQQRTLEAARRGTLYTSEQLPLFYDLIGSALDAIGQPQQAIEAYKKGIEYVLDAANLYFNMAVTYYESLKDPDEARHALKKAAAIEPTNADVELMLGQIFEANGYHTPAFFALSKFLVIRPAGNGSLQGYAVWRSVLRAGMDPVRGVAPGDGAMRTPSQHPAKMDEGNFADLDRQFAATHLAGQDAMDKGKSEIEALVAQVDVLLTAIAKRDPGAERSTFTWTHYAPYFTELKQKNFVEPFVYWVSQRAPVPGVRDWLDSNEGRVGEFLQWTLKYNWPRG
jgi:tetratricopeptide (TPR) repeat protein